MLRHEAYWLGPEEFVGEVPERADMTVTHVEDSMNAGNDMKVKVDRKKVLTMVKANRIKHKKDYEEALKGWIEEMKQDTADAARVAKKLTVRRVLTYGAAKMVEPIRVSLHVPRQYLTEYDQVIGMLEVCVEEHLELTGKQINAWCHDRWQWKDEFVTCNSTYMDK